VVVVQAHQALLLLPVALRVLRVQAAATTVAALVAAQAPVLRPSGMVRGLAPARLVTVSHAAVVRLAMISQRVRSQQFAARVTASRNRRSCTKSRRSIASRLPSNWTSCQADHAAKSRLC
jgi:hypothetical protein